MFENRKDTTILRDALISAHNFMNDKEKNNEIYDPVAEAEALKIVSSSISSLSCSLYTVHTFHELFEQQISFGRRCHTVLFINLLNSNNITSSEGNTYYQSVIFDIPCLNWHFYLKLSFLCHWSEYFIECAEQLEPYPLALVLKKLLQQPCDGELKCYTWHLVLQTYIWKTFTSHCPSLINSESRSLFKFEFAVTKELPLENICEKNDVNVSLSEVFDTLLSSFTQESEQNLNIDFIKVILHGFKTLFRLIRSISGDEGPSMEKHNLLTPFLVQCLSREAARDLILNSLEEDQKCLVDSSYQTMSWDVGETYLLFILQNFWRDALELPPDYLATKVLPSCIQDYKSELILSLEKENVSRETVIDLVECRFDTSEALRNKYWLLLCNVVKYHYPYASRADEYLLSNPVIWKTYNILGLQEENIAVLNPYELHCVLVDAITNEESNENRGKLLTIFYKLLSQASPKIYDIALKYIIKNHGYCEKFKLPDFEAQLTQFQRKTESLKKSEEYLLPLLVQSPIAVLKSLIEQAMMQGQDGMQLLQVFKTIPTVCLYETESAQHCPLITEISTYFEKNLTLLEMKNFLLLIKALFEIDSQEKILTFDLFLEHCIFPYLTVDYASKLECTTEYLNVALIILITRKSLKLQYENYVSLIHHMRKVLKFSIKHCLIKLKENALVTLQLIAKHEDWKLLLNDILQVPVNEESSAELLFDQDDILAIMYIFGTFCNEVGQDTYKETNLCKWIFETTKYRLDLLFMWCIITNDLEHFQSKLKDFTHLSYTYLLEILGHFLWYSSKSEWLFSATLLKECKEVLEIDPSEYPWLLPNVPFDDYFIIRCLMDCFITIVQESSLNDILYLYNCFSNIVMSILNENQAELLLQVFLDICHLVSMLPFEGIEMFSPLLLTIRKKLLSQDLTFPSAVPEESFVVDRKVGNSVSLKFLKIGMDSLPDSVTKKTLINKISKV